jgi:hypothetical protein
LLPRRTRGQTLAYLEFQAKSRAGTRLTNLGIGTKTFLILPPDPVGLTQAVELGKALETVHPAAQLVPVLNMFLGRYAAIQTSPVWRETVEPFLKGRTVLKMPTLDPDIWQLFDDQNLTFHDVSHATEENVMKWFKTGWTTAATLQGEINAWLDELWSQIEAIVSPSSQQGGDNA